MPTLDPVLHHPSRTGPTRDLHAIAAIEPVYRQEVHYLKPGRLPVSMNASMRARPKARSGGNPDTGFRLAKIPVLVRNSNQRPQEAGTGTDRSVMSLSDPSLAGEAPVIAPLVNRSLLMGGIALGALAFLLLRK